MSFQKRKPRRDYRNHLTAEEARELAEIDVRAAALDAERRQLTAARNLLVNRAGHRAAAQAKAESLRARAA